jgi:hypothetical protein
MIANSVVVRMHLTRDPFEPFYPKTHPSGKRDVDLSVFARQCCG